MVPRVVDGRVISVDGPLHSKHGQRRFGSLTTAGSRHRQSNNTAGRGGRRNNTIYQTTTSRGCGCGTTNQERRGSED